jgi:hypothetical protein
MMKHERLIPKQLSLTGIECNFEDREFACTKMENHQMSICPVLHHLGDIPCLINLRDMRYWGGGCVRIVLQWRLQLCQQHRQFSHAAVGFRRQADSRGDPIFPAGKQLSMILF